MYTLHTVAMYTTQQPSLHKEQWPVGIKFTATYVGMVVAMLWNTFMYDQDQRTEESRTTDTCV